MRLTREKIIRLSHQITEVLVESQEVEFIDDRDTIRQQVVQILTATLKDEEKIELEVRKRITSQKKKSWKAARNGTCSTKSITMMNFAAWASLRLLTTASALNCWGVVVSLQLSVVGEEAPGATGLFVIAGITRHCCLYRSAGAQDSRRRIGTSPGGKSISIANSNAPN